VCFFNGLIPLIAIFCSATISADIALDGTLGNSGTINGPTYLITESLGERHGSNLFHSFSIFSINQGESATFSGALGIDNVIGRVTGGTPSIIDGALNSSIPGADLYLVNPAGILFGQNASLDVQSAFYATTANHLSLSDGGRFDATSPNQSILSVAPVSAFGFAGNQIAPIKSAGAVLLGTRGNAISFIGGDIDIVESALLVDEGQVNLVSVASSGEIKHISNRLTPTGFDHMGAISIIAADPVGVGIASTGNEGVGISIIGSRFQMKNGALHVTNVDEPDSAGINLRLTGDLILESSAITTNTLGSGNGGNVELNVGGDIALSDSTTIISNSDLSGNGGDIIVNADKSMTIYDPLSYIRAATSYLGDAGDIKITTPILTVISGSIKYDIFSFEETGMVGDITLHLAELQLLDGGKISIDTQGETKGGDLIVNATEKVTIEGRNLLNERSFITSTSGFLASGDAGSVQVNTQTLQMDNGIIQATTSGRGNGGSITINASQMQLSNGGAVSANTYGAGNGGDLNITADRAYLSGNGNIFQGELTSGFISDANSLVSGDAGNLHIQIGELIMEDGAQISATTHGPGAGGDIQINSSTIILSGKRFLSTGITANSIFAAGHAGILYIETGKLDISNGALVEASTSGSGIGGSVSIQAQQEGAMAGILRSKPSISSTFPAHKMIYAPASSARPLAPGMLEIYQLIVADWNSMTGTP